MPSYVCCPVQNLKAKGGYYLTVLKNVAVLSKTTNKFKGSVSGI